MDIVVYSLPSPLTLGETISVQTKPTVSPHLRHGVDLGDISSAYKATSSGQPNTLHLACPFPDRMGLNQLPQLLLVELLFIFKPGQGDFPGVGIVSRFSF
ncbi:hypothetical protein ES703_98129 [subsurface metagenome]